ncbi:hypothetical protein BD408DRAFT_436731 [Parasitella parasitica]|nr:hypothetical protein BD408DRAFT_436731 [Parasitella parasitica]
MSSLEEQFQMVEQQLAAIQALLLLCGQRTTLLAFPFNSMDTPLHTLYLIDEDNVTKLVLGSKTMNVLFTSSTRLESNQLSIVGAL